MGFVRQALMDAFVQALRKAGLPESSFGGTAPGAKLDLVVILLAQAGTALFRQSCLPKRLDIPVPIIRPAERRQHISEI